MFFLAVLCSNVICDYKRYYQPEYEHQQVQSGEESQTIGMVIIKNYRKIDVFHRADLLSPKIRENKCAKTLFFIVHL
jgi:hypothetical protein